MYERTQNRIYSQKSQRDRVQTVAYETSFIYLHGTVWNKRRADRRTDIFQDSFVSHILGHMTIIYIYIYFFFFCCGAATQRGSWPPHSWGFLDNTQRRTTVGRTPLDSSSQRPLPGNTQHSQQTNIHAPRWDSNPRSQQASGRRPTP